MTQRLLHLSDLHFGAEDPQACRALLDLSWQLAPQVIVCSGDLTQRATPEQFRQASRFLQLMPAVPKVVVPGNHDLPAVGRWVPGRDAYRSYRQYIGRDLEPTVQVGMWQVVGVNTSRWWLHERGGLSRGQIERVRRQLAAAHAAQCWPVVVAHHPLAVSRTADRADRPLRFREALQRWAGAAEATVLGGHLHETWVRRIVPDATRSHEGLWVVQAGTATSTRRVHGLGNSVVVLEAEGSDPVGVRSVKHWEYDPVDRCFVPAAESVLQAPMPMAA